jgi:hypothetical protein
MIYKSLLCLALAGSVIACSSSPYEPVNQTGPIRSMDSFFSGGRTSGYAASPGYGYRRAPGYDYPDGSYSPRY